MLLRPVLALALVAALGLAVWSGPASAAERRSVWLSDTRDLLDLCTLPADDPQRDEAFHYCLAYLDGVVDYHDVLTTHKEMKRLICYPSTATLEQGLLVFVRWAQKKQGDDKMMGEPPVVGVVRALAKEWPCTPK